MNFNEQNRGRVVKIYVSVRNHGFNSMGGVRSLVQAYYKLKNRPNNLVTIIFIVTKTPFSKS